MEPAHQPRIAVVGFGYWGPNVARNLFELETCALAAICDESADRRTFAGRRYPTVPVCADAGDVFSDPTIDAVVITTPVWTHFGLADAALQAGKHVLVSKPLTDAVDDAERLVSTAEDRGLILMVDHTFVYTGAVRAMKELVDSGAVGEVYYFDSTRLNL